MVDTNSNNTTSSNHRARSQNKLIMLKNQIKSIICDAFMYSTVRSATINSKKVGVVYRISQLLILFYII